MSNHHIYHNCTGCGSEYCVRCTRICPDCGEKYYSPAEILEAKKSIWIATSGQPYDLEEGIKRGDFIALKLNKAEVKDGRIDGWEIEENINN